MEIASGPAVVCRRGESADRAAEREVGVADSDLAGDTRLVVGLAAPWTNSQLVAWPDATLGTAFEAGCNHLHQPGYASVPRAGLPCWRNTGKATRCRYRLHSATWFVVMSSRPCVAMTCPMVSAWLRAGSFGARNRGNPRVNCPEKTKAAEAAFFVGAADRR